jgi:hypothetical protein
MKPFPLFVATVTVAAVASSASAQGKGAGATKAPHVTAAPKTGGQTSHGPKAGPSTASGKSAAATKKPAAASASHRGDKSGKTGSDSTSSTSTTPGSGSSTTPSTGTTAAADATPPNPISIKISKNPNQLARLQPQLDALGLTLEEATDGFRNHGQFIAAMNAAKNRQLDFVALKEAMTVDGLSLGQAAKLQTTPPAPETPPAGDAGTGSTGTRSTGTGSTGTGSTGSGSTGTGTTGTGSTGQAQ